MRALYIDPTRKTPLVQFDPQEGVFCIQGHSIPEDSIGFYQPLFEWMTEYLPTHSGPLVLEIALQDFNTASRKCMMFLFQILNSNLPYNPQLSILWVCDEDDEDMVETGEDFAELIDVPIRVTVRAF